MIASHDLTKSATVSALSWNDAVCLRDVHSVESGPPAGHTALLMLRLLKAKARCLPVVVDGRCRMGCAALIERSITEKKRDRARRALRVEAASARSSLMMSTLAFSRSRGDNVCGPSSLGLGSGAAGKVKGTRGTVQMCAARIIEGLGDCSVERRLPFSHEGGRLRAIARTPNSDSPRPFLTMIVR